MTEPHDSMIATLSRVILAIAGWFGAVELAQIQVIVAILSGVCVGVYAALQIVFLLRDRMRR